MDAGGEVWVCVEGEKSVARTIPVAVSAKAVNVVFI